MYLGLFILLVGIGIIYEFDRIKKNVNNLENRISDLEDNINDATESEDEIEEKNE